MVVSLLALACERAPATNGKNVVVPALLEILPAVGTERLQAVSVVSQDVVWVSGTGGAVWQSANGGRTWRDRSIAGAPLLEIRDIAGLSELGAYALSAGAGELSRILVTRDGGQTWQERWRNHAEEAFFDCLSVLPSGRAYAWSDSVDGEFPVVQSADGEAWSEARLPLRALPGEGGFAASGTCLATIDESIWIGTGGGEHARILRSLDRGVSWSQQTTPIVASGTASGITSVVPLDTRTVFIFGGEIGDSESRGARAARTDDGGETWRLLEEPAFAGAIYGGAGWRGSGEPARLLVAGPGGAALSLDGGARWLPISALAWWSAAFLPDGSGLLVGPQGRIARVSTTEGQAR